MTNKYQFFVVGDSDRLKDEVRVKKLADIPCKLSQLYKIPLPNFIKSLSQIL